MLIEVQADESESFADVLDLIKQGFGKYEVINHLSLLKTISKTMRKIFDSSYGVEAKDIFKSLLISLQNSIKDFQTKANFKENFTSDFFVNSVFKYNILLSQQSLQTFFSDKEI